MLYYAPAAIHYAEYALSLIIRMIPVKMLLLPRRGKFGLYGQLYE